MVGITSAGAASSRRSQNILLQTLLRFRVDNILYFVLGVILTNLIKLHPGSPTGSTTSTVPSIASSHGSSLISPPPPNDWSTTSSSSTKKETSFQTQHAMAWKTPAHIAHQRDEECKSGKISKTGGFCLTRGRNTGGNEMYDEPMATFLAREIFNGKTVVDLGAGLGHYGVIFQKVAGTSVDWVGYDGAINVQGATDGLVRFMDLTQPHASDERPCVAGDWVMSLEVAEHIPVEHTDAFLRNVRCHAREGAVISWALPSQTGGLGHVNMREEKDAIEAVEKWGFQVDWDLTNRTRASATLSHFTRTPVVYRVVN